MGNMEDALRTFMGAFGGDFGGNGGGFFEGLFGGLGEAFGMRGGSESSRQGASKKVHITLSFEEAAKGVEKNFLFQAINLVMLVLVVEPILLKV